MGMQSTTVKSPSAAADERAKQTSVPNAAPRGGKSSARSPQRTFPGRQSAPPESPGLSPAFSQIPVTSRPPAASTAAPGTSHSSLSLPPLPLQRKLAIGATNDPLEHEADRVADRFCACPIPPPSHHSQRSHNSLRRKCSCGGSGTCEECKSKKLQRSPTTSATTGVAPPIVHDVLRSPGHPLDSATRAFFEPRFGRDFSHVRVHTDEQAASSAKSIHALAYTAGPSIAFASGQYAPETPAGRTLLSHELTHVVQQASFLDRNLGGAPVLDAAHPSEQEARAGTGAATPLAGPAIQRAPLDLVKSAKQLVIDLTNSSWRQTLDFAGGQTQVVYVLRDATTGEFLKIGKTTVAQVSGRFGEYVTAGKTWSRKLVADVWTFRARSEKSAEAFEAELRSGFEKAGARLPWDNTRIPGRGPRLGRPGQGIPMPKEQTETEFIDEVERLRVKHAPPKIPPRRGMSSKRKAKLKKAAEEQAAEDAGTKAEQDTEQAAADTATKATPEVDQATEKVGTQATSKLEQAATDTALKAGAEGALTRGLGATALEVVFNPALMLGWEILKGISGDYQQAWDDIRRPAHHVGFAQGWAARLAGLDIKWIKWNLAPQFVDRSNVAVEVLGAAGMAEQAFIVGLGEGFSYGAGYSNAMKLKKLEQAYDKIKARDEEVYFDTDNQLDAGQPNPRRGNAPGGCRSGDRPLGRTPSAAQEGGGGSGAGRLLEAPLRELERPLPVAAARSYPRITCTLRATTPTPATPIVGSLEMVPRSDLFSPLILAAATARVTSPNAGTGPTIPSRRLRWNS